MRQMTLVGFLQAQNCTNFVGSWRHPEARARISPPPSITAASAAPWKPANSTSASSTTAWPCRTVRRRPRAHRRQRHPLREDGPDHHPDRHGHGDRDASASASTYTTTYFEPFHVARVFATLDLMTDGRAAWNVVTSMNDGEAHEHGPAVARRSRPPLRPRRRVHGSRAWATGTRGRTTRSSPTARPACSRIPTRCIAWTTRANSSARAARSPCRARRRAIRSSSRPAKAAAADVSPRAGRSCVFVNYHGLAQAQARLRRLQGPGRSRRPRPGQGVRLRRRLSRRRRDPRRGRGQGRADRQAAEGDRQPVAAVGSAELRFRRRSRSTSRSPRKKSTAGPACRACATA